jgi:hypothetical protein
MRVKKERKHEGDFCRRFFEEGQEQQKRRMLTGSEQGSSLAEKKKIREAEGEETRVS